MTAAVSTDRSDWNTPGDDAEDDTVAAAAVYTDIVAVDRASLSPSSGVRTTAEPDSRP